MRIPILLAPAVLAFCLFPEVSRPRALSYQQPSPQQPSQPVSGSLNPSVQRPAPSAAQPTAKLKKDKKEKKVWTNENMNSLKSGVSVVCDPAQNNAARSSAGGRAETIPASEVASYRTQLHNLRSELQQVEEELNTLQHFNGVPTAAHMQQLENRRKQLRGRIETLEDEARKHGIEPGQLR